MTGVGAALRGIGKLIDVDPCAGATVPVPGLTTSM
jgi:hypothetical protein